MALLSHICSAFVFCYDTKRKPFLRFLSPVITKSILTKT
jgi:hypothetical protein